MNTNWKELKDTLLDLYRRYYDNDKKYREYLENTHNLQDLEDYRNSFSDHRPTPYFVLQHIKDLSEDGRGKQDKYILYYLLHIDSMLERLPIVHKMLSIIDADYNKKEETFMKSLSLFCENKNDPYSNYQSHIESAISISAKYNYGISLPSTILCTE